MKKKKQPRIQSHGVVLGSFRIPDGNQRLDVRGYYWFPVFCNKHCFWQTCSTDCKSSHTFVNPVENIIVEVEKWKYMVMDGNNVDSRTEYLLKGGMWITCSWNNKTF